MTVLGTVWHCFSTVWHCLALHWVYGTLRNLKNRVYGTLRMRIWDPENEVLRMRIWDPENEVLDGCLGHAWDGYWDMPGTGLGTGICMGWALAIPGGPHG